MNERTSGKLGWLKIVNLTDTIGLTPSICSLLLLLLLNVATLSIVW